MIYIEHPRVVEWQGKSRLITLTKVNNEVRPLFFEVENEYAQYLCYERSDAFLIAILNYAMRFNHNIVCEAPVTEELFYNINEYLIPSLADNDSNLSRITIEAPIESEPVKNAGAVGSGMSCGVDSFHVIANCCNSNYKSMNLTHLCINSVGSFHRGYAKYGVVKAREDVRQKAQSVADELNLPLIITNSNIKSRFNIFFAHNHTYYSMFAVYCMQKLWKTYYYASGITFADFDLHENSKKDTAFYDLLLLRCLSTHNLQLYSEGAPEDRLAKTKAIVNHPLAQKYLHVCCVAGQNCGKCLKCRRTLLTLDILGKLDDFREVFDIDYYRENRKEYLTWLYRSTRQDNPVLQPIYQTLQKEFDCKFLLKYYYDLYLQITTSYFNKFKQWIVRKCYDRKVVNGKVKLRILFARISYKSKNNANNNDSSQLFPGNETINND